MRTRYIALAFALLCCPLSAVTADADQAQSVAERSPGRQVRPAPVAVSPASAKAQLTDWGGGYVRGPDSASITPATSGAGAVKATPILIPAAPANAPLTDWGGGYLRGPDSAATTIATSGAGAPKPNN